ncbi:hypothetical protein [Haloferula rosea]|uniref:NlpC/P60 domain-containing protein n=1 Tax=Haloferula rosea TaxID=490093 RepID=A0A934RAR4_9BACT|nr:hypothetical protein [Haloferula rosea]MBK1827572.1 hypothetical protein [Haloferula rosea]
MRILFALLAAASFLSSCATDPWGIPGPADTVTAADAIATAHTYSALTWMPETRHIKHGPDERGILVHTPDQSLNQRGFANGWWKPGTEARGMAYQWGGFDTPREFLRSLEEGEFAGDISTSAKRRLGDSGTSESACGIDCSGFVSRCWRLPKPYSTRQLPSICVRLKSWLQLAPGDILLNDKHVLLFAGWDSTRPGCILAYEAGPFPVWRVNAASIPTSKLERENYAPWRYRGMRP